MEHETYEQPFEHEHLVTPPPEARSFPNAEFPEHELSLADHLSVKLPEHYDGYFTFMERDKELQASCKTEKFYYGIFDDHDHLASIEGRPAICGSPFCTKCAVERASRLALQHAPRLDDVIYPYQMVRHVVTTTPTFPSSELPDRVEQLFSNTSRFHEKLRKTYYKKRKHPVTKRMGVVYYPFNALLGIELKYDAQNDSYYFHVHYGILNTHFSIKRFRDIYQKTWGETLIVKYPIDKHGNKKPFSNKWAWLEYVCRRIVQTRMLMPHGDYYHHLRDKQLFRCIGFTKAQSRILTTIRNNYSEDRELPDGWHRIFLGKLAQHIDLRHFGERYRHGYTAVYNENCDIATVKDMARRAFRDVVDELADEQQIAERHEEITLRRYAPPILHGPCIQT